MSESNTDLDFGVPKGPKAIVLEYNRNIKKSKIVQTIQNNVRHNPKVDYAQLEERFNQLAAAFDPPQKGDRYEFVYTPGKGTAMIKDGLERTVIPGADFAFAFFGIWTGDHLEDQTLRRQLLALEPVP